MTWAHVRAETPFGRMAGWRCTVCKALTFVEREPFPCKHPTLRTPVPPLPRKQSNA